MNLQYDPQSSLALDRDEWDQETARLRSEADSRDMRATEFLAVFHAGTIPGDPAGWPRSEAGTPYMPMAGRFLVRNPDGDMLAQNGFLTIVNGHPHWQPEVPAPDLLEPA